MRRTALALLAVAALALAAPLPIRAEGEDDPLAGLSAAKALETVKVLAAPATKGRRTGTDGGRFAEDWVQSVMGELALDPMDGEGIYLHTFTYGAKDVVAPIAVSIDGKALAYRTDFTELTYTGDGTVEAEVVFVGYGISAKDRGWDDYDGVDVKGKVVLAIRGAPTSREGDFAQERLIGWKSAFAASRGAAAFLLVEGASPVAGGTLQERYHRPALPAVWISTAAADRALAKKGATLDTLRRARDAGDPGRSFATGTTARVEVHGRFAPSAQARNLLGGFHGRDPDLRGEVVVVGAHLDHLGVDPTGAVYPGADDNASGVAVILELARTLRANRWKPPRTVVFCAFAGEEQGLVGSRRLVAELPFPHDAVVAMLNVDAVGVGKPEVAAGGREAHPAFWARSLARVPGGTAVLTPFRAEPSSDHWPFLEHGIPALFFRTNGDHPAYHTPADTADTVKSEVLEAAARAVGRVLVSVVEDPASYEAAKLLPERLLTEGPRVVEGAVPAKAVLDWLEAGSVDGGAKGASAAAGLRETLERSGWTAVALPVDLGQGDAAAAWGRLAGLAKGREKLSLIHI